MICNADQELKQLIDCAKDEQAQAIRRAIVTARLRIMAEEIFPANHEWKEAA